MGNMTLAETSDLGSDTGKDATLRREIIVQEIEIAQQLAELKRVVAENEARLSKLADALSVDGHDRIRISRQARAASEAAASASAEFELYAAELRQQLEKEQLDKETEDKARTAAAAAATAAQKIVQHVAEMRHLIAELEVLGSSSGPVMGASLKEEYEKEAPTPGALSSAATFFANWAKWAQSIIWPKSKYSVLSSPKSKSKNIPLPRCMVLFVQFSPDIISILAAAPVSFFLSSGVTFALLCFRRGASIAEAEALLHL